MADVDILFPVSPKRGPPRARKPRAPAPPPDAATLKAKELVQKHKAAQADLPPVSESEEQPHEKPKRARASAAAKPKPKGKGKEKEVLTPRKAVSSKKDKRAAAATQLAVLKDKQKAKHKARQQEKGGGAEGGEEKKKRRPNRRMRMHLASQKYEQERFVFKPARIIRITRRSGHAAAKRAGLPKDMTYTPAALAIYQTIVEERLHRFFTLAAIVMDKNGDYRTLTAEMFDHVRALERHSRPNASADEVTLNWVKRDAERCARQGKKMGGPEEAEEEEEGDAMEVEGEEVAAADVEADESSSSSESGESDSE